MAEPNVQPQKDRAEAMTPERTRAGASFLPRMDVYEDDNELILYADMPGIRPEDVDLRYEQGELVLHGRLRPRQRQGQYLLREYDEGDYYRVFQIHESVDNNRIEAACKNGVLTIHLPKTKPARPRQIAVRSP